MKASSDTHAPGRAARIDAILRKRLASIEHLSVIDDSARHAGHAGAREGGETHYTVEIVSEAFAEMNRVARSRLVHDALAAEFNSGLHALALVLRTPREAGQD